MQPKPLFKLEGHLFFWLTQVIGVRDRRLTTELKQFGLRVPEYRVLAALYARKGSTMSELADLSSIDRTTLTRTVDRMQDSGWLARLADTQDMRVIRLALTGSGDRLFVRIWPAVDALNRAALEKLPPGTADLLHRTLAQMKANLENEPASNERAA